MREFPWFAVHASCSCLLVLLAIVIYSTTLPVPLSKLQVAPKHSNYQSVTTLELCPKTSSNLSMFLRPIGLNTRANTGEYSYLLPPTSNAKALTEEELENKTVFVFIHINKAGGTLFKYRILHEAAKSYRWDAAGFGSVFGWQRLAQTCNTRTRNMVYPTHTELESFACGQRAELTACGPKNGGKCPMRVIWGSHSLPLCSLVPKGTPCVMAVVLRHPVDRLISQYNYVCIEGSEGRKKWSLEWKQKNYCPLTLLEFLNRTEDLTSETFLIDHLAMSPRCGSAVAIQNLRHPCMRYLLLDRMKDGIQRLSQVWGPAMRPFLQRLGKTTTALNTAQYSSRIQEQMSDAGIIAEVRRKLKLDIDFYEQAVLGYEEQWLHPLHSCV